MHKTLMMGNILHAWSKVNQRRDNLYKYSSYHFINLPRYKEINDSITISLKLYEKKTFQVGLIKKEVIRR